MLTSQLSLRFPPSPCSLASRLTLVSASSQVAQECCVWQMYLCLLAQKFKYCGTRMITGETVCLQITEKNSAASPTEHHPQPILPLKCMLGFETIYWWYKSSRALEVRGRLSNNQQGKKQQIARLSRLAIATTSKRNLKKTQTKEFTSRNRANESSSACCQLTCCCYQTYQEVNWFLKLPWESEGRILPTRNSLRWGETFLKTGAEQKVNPATELSGCTA